MPIDIMMPFYGDVGQLRIAVQSVLAQDSPDWRLVVIDDRYPGDAHTAYLASIDDPRVEVVVNERNLGVAGNFQRSVDLATASHCTIMGCDDILLPGYVGRMKELIGRTPGAAYFQPGVQVIDENGDPTTPLADRVKSYYRWTRRNSPELAGEALATSLLRGNWTYFPSICWQTATIRRHGFDPDFGVVLDLALQFEIATSGGVLVIDEVPIFRYRRHRASVSSATAVDGSRFEEERRFFAYAAERSAALGWRTAARVARRQLSSRLNAATRIPSAVVQRDRHGVGVLLGHVFGRRRAPGGTRPQ